MYLPFVWLSYIVAITVFEVNAATSGQTASTNKRKINKQKPEPYFNMQFNSHNVGFIAEINFIFWIQREVK